MLGNSQVLSSATPSLFTSGVAHKQMCKTHNYIDWNLPSTLNITNFTNF